MRSLSRDGSRFSAVAATSWLSLGIADNWTAWPRPKMCDHLEEKNENLILNTKYWVLLGGVRECTNCVDVCFKSLQGKNRIIPEQEVRLGDPLNYLGSTVNFSVYEDEMDLLVIVKESTVIASDVVEDCTLVVR